MRILIILSVVFSCVSSSYAVAAAPKVTCELMYTKTDASGASVEFTSGRSVAVSSKESKQLTKGFVLGTKLTQTCAADGGPCYDAYNLRVTVEKGSSQSYLSATVDSKTNRERYSTGLKVDNENGFVNCDVNAN